MNAFAADWKLFWQVGSDARRLVFAAHRRGDKDDARRDFAFDEHPDKTVADVTTDAIFERVATVPQLNASKLKKQTKPPKPPSLKAYLRQTPNAGPDELFERNHDSDRKLKR